MDDLSEFQLRALAMLAVEAQRSWSAGQVALEARMDVAVARRALNDLVALGLVRREQHARSHRFTVSAAGRRMGRRTEEYVGLQDRFAWRDLARALGYPACAVVA